jgi:predicted transcriptional regulator YheO
VEQNRKPNQQSQNGLKAEALPATKTILVDITPEYYREMKKQYMKQIPKIVRPFITQYFDWLRKLDAGEVMDWMESSETLKELYAKRTFPERAAIAGVRGVLRISPTLKRRANEAINLDIACYTLRFENPLVWEVITAYGEKGIQKLKEAIEDFKDILKLKEETEG